MEFRKAEAGDLHAVSRIYEAIHTEEEGGEITSGWIRSVYPTDETAKTAMQRSDLFVGIEDNAIVGTAIINKQQIIF